MVIDSSLMDHTKNVLKKFGDKYFNDGTLKKNKVIKDLNNYNNELIESLLSDKLIRDVYVQDNLNVSIFKLNEFIEMFEYKDYWKDSYTKYENRIGLHFRDEFIDDDESVVLDFPFKDTVLAAGMENDKTDDIEPFLNETMAKSEIDELFEPKILKNVKKYDIEGEHDINSFDDNDNLILKGNNLIALHSIKKRYMGKVKLIYLDPPYYFNKNVNNDTFKYNSNFKLSTWLVFMKNRLEIAKDLLKDDGSIIVQMNDDGVSYLKILMDSIFGVDNFVNQIAVKMSEPTGTKMAHTNLRLPKLKEHLLLYKKNKIKINPVMIPKEKWDVEYKTYLKNFSLADFNVLNNISNKEQINDEDIHHADEILKKIKFISINDVLKEKKIKENDKNQFLKENAFRIVQIASITGGSKKLADEKSKSNMNNAFAIKTPNGSVYFIKNNYDKSKKSPRIKILFAEKYLTVNAGDFWSDIKTTGLDSEAAGLDFTNGEKPERLIMRIINMLTEPNDLVLDFFMGSGTTQAVSMKLNRRFIGVEQLDYINTISIPRLNKVIHGEQTGISKDVNWKGGGSFVYAEVMEKNQGYMKDIQKASNKGELLNVFERILSNADIDFRVDLIKLKKQIQTNISFHDLKIELVSILDKNQLYYNYLNIDDSDIRDLMSKSDYEFNNDFYK